MPYSGVAQDSRVAALDGLRAIAVGLVILNHTALPNSYVVEMFEPFQAGPFGVRLFFVLSGFLITGILTRARAEAERTGGSRMRVLGAFYVRRGLRIFPVAYLALAIAWLIGDISMTRYPLWYLTYTPNILIANIGWHGTMARFWSLAVEEQFYLIWPFVILWLPYRWLVPALIGAIAMVGALRGAMVANESWITAFVLLWSRGDSLAFGALLALVPSLPLRLMAGLGVALVALGAVVVPTVHVIVSEWGLILISGAIIAAALNGRMSWLRWRPLVALGTISYGLYVWHGFVPIIMRAVDRHWDVWPDHQGAIRLAYALVLSPLMAMLSWFWLEKPLNALKNRVPYVPDRAAESAAGASSGSVIA